MLETIIKVTTLKSKTKTMKHGKDKNIITNKTKMKRSLTKAKNQTTKKKSTQCKSYIVQ